jgi:hypothetical protein
VVNKNKYLGHNLSLPLDELPPGEEPGQVAAAVPLVLDDHAGLDIDALIPALRSLTENPAE